MKDYNKITGELLKEYRIKKGLTQLEVANKMNIRDTAVSNYELGLRNITLSILKSYCDAIGIEMSEIVDKL